MKALVLAAGLGVATCGLASDDLVPKLGSGELIPEPAFSISNQTYQIGSEWGKVPVSEEQFAELPTLQSIAEGTVRIGGATGFYLGKFNGQHLVATNNHVCPSRARCGRATANFTMAGKSIRVKEFLGSWPSIDLAILALRDDPRNESFLSTVKNPILFDKDLTPGQELITVGYGRANNTWRRLMGNWDSDCKIFSGENEFRLMKDPDELNPGQYETWSFSNGCDVSHGDSGSAMVDRATGAVIGIIWTGRVPKQSRIQDSTYLEQIFADGDEEIWTQLSYGVPAAKMKERLIEFASDETTLESTATTIRALLSQQPEN
ncbi:MAG: trypsin-like peptidase domain-containing protein [Pseudobacteriovorax sp.]|nr:trypsin-like peptidase domain-containing protein [Pseudobacteriovorax sp.]